MVAVFGIILFVEIDQNMQYGVYNASLLIFLLYLELL